jgi:hypothetical protein
VEVINDGTHANNTMVHPEHATFRIGIVSGKLGGVDGVSLEVDKWIAILNEMGTRFSRSPVRIHNRSL